MFEFVANLLGILAVCLAVAQWSAAKAAAPITVTLHRGAGESAVVLRFTVPKSQFSRAELLGRLGMFAKGGRFSVASFSNPSMLCSIDAVVTGKKKTLDILLTEAEVEQFQR